MVVFAFLPNSTSSLLPPLLPVIRAARWSTFSRSMRSAQYSVRKIKDISGPRQTLRGVRDTYMLLDQDLPSCRSPRDVAVRADGWQRLLLYDMQDIQPNGKYRNVLYIVNAATNIQGLKKLLCCQRRPRITRGLLQSLQQTLPSLRFLSLPSRVLHIALDHRLASPKSDPLPLQIPWIDRR